MPLEDFAGRFGRAGATAAPRNMFRGGGGRSVSRGGSRVVKRGPSASGRDQRFGNTPQAGLGGWGQKLAGATGQTPAAPAPAPAPTQGGSTRGRRARRQLRAQQAPAPAAATGQTGAGQVKAQPAPQTVNQLAGQFPGAPPPPPAAPGFGAGVAQAIGGAGRPQAVNAAGRIDPANAPAPQALYAGQNMGGGSAAGMWGGSPAFGPQPMAPAPGPGAEPAPIGGEDPRRRFLGQAGGGGGWGNVLGLGG